MNRLSRILLCLLLWSALQYEAGTQNTTATTTIRVASFSIAEDKDYKPKIDKPAYDTDGPVVLLDGGHRNIPHHQGLLRLLGADGYRVQQSDGRFSFDALRKADILVIANPGTMRNRKFLDDPEPIFTEEEAAALHDWVAGGGALLITSGPQGSGAEVTRRFGIEFSESTIRDTELALNDFVEAKQHYPVFAHDKGTLTTHRIITGRSESEQVKAVLVQSMDAIVKAPENALPLLRCTEKALLVPIDSLQMKELHSPASLAKAETEGEVISSPAPRPMPVPAAHVPIAVAFTFGKGRVVVLGSGWELNALIQVQVIDGKKSTRRTGLMEADNQQFALNIMHWLSGLLE